MKAILPIGRGNHPTVLIDDTYAGHWISPEDMPMNVDRHPIPGGATKED